MSLISLHLEMAGCFWSPFLLLHSSLHRRKVYWCYRRWCHEDREDSLTVSSGKLISDLKEIYWSVKIRTIFLVHLQEANILQQKLETEVSILVSMVKNENCGRSVVFVPWVDLTSLVAVCLNVSQIRYNLSLRGSARSAMKVVKMCIKNLMRTFSFLFFNPLSDINLQWCSTNRRWR